MAFSTTHVNLLVLGLPYLGLMVFSAYQFVQKREQAPFHRMLLFTTFSLFILLRVVGGIALDNGYATAAGLLLRLSLVSLLAATYILLLFASDLSNTGNWLDWSAGAVLVLLSSVVLLAPAQVDDAQRITFRLHPPLVPELVWLIVFAGSVFIICQCCRVSFRLNGAIRQRLHCISGGTALIVVSLALILVAYIQPTAAAPTAFTEQALLLLTGLVLLPGFAPPNWLRRFWMLPKREGMTTLASDLILSAPPQESVSDEQRQTQGLLLMLQRAVNDLSAEGGIVQLWNPTLGELECAVLLLADEQASPPGSKPVDETLLAEAFHQEQAIFRQGSPRWLYLLRRHTRGRTMLVAPIVAQGRTLGVLGIACGPRSLFAEDDLALLEGFAGQMALWLVYQQQAQSTALVQSLRTDQAQKDVFIAEIVHELRTPLTVMKGRLQLLRRQLNKEGLTTAAEAVNTLDDPFNRLGQLISTLMDVSYIDAGRMELLRHVLDLSGLVRKVVERAGAARPVSLELAGQNEDDADSVQPILVMGDSARLELVMDCLLSNARKYSTEESQILVRLERPAEAGEVVVSVQDCGIGISPEDQQRVFQRWFRATTSSARRFGGIGLSLYLSAQIISMHGGRIWVESSGMAGEGSTFFFSLPLVAPQEVGGLSDQAQGQDGNQES